MSTILVVEDDDFFRAALKAILESEDYQYLEAPNGKVAKNIIEVSSIDLILSDVQMPYCSGVELLEWVKKNKDTKFILMTGFSHIMETYQAFEKGADGFISKPFSDQQLLEEITKCLTPKKAETDLSKKSTETKEEDFCKVSIDEFVAQNTLSFDIYVRLRENKFLKIGHKGAEIPIERKDNYKEKGLKHLYIQKEDFRQLIQFNLHLSKVVKKSNSVSNEKKAQFMKYTGEIILEKAFVDDVDQETFNDAKEFLNNSIEILTEDDTTFDLLAQLNTHSDHLYAHCLCVSMYSIMIAKEMGHCSSQTFFKLSMAGLLHDIGKKEIDPEILNKPRAMLSYQERQIIETHPTRGREILSELKTIPSDVIQCVYEHHEDCLGQGFPRGIGKNHIHPLAKIISAANIFAGYAIKSPNHPGMSGANAIQEIKKFHENKVDKQVLSAFSKVFAS